MGIDWESINPKQLKYVEQFECVICKEILKNPKICMICKNRFCNFCIKEWLKTQNVCPFKCSANLMKIKNINLDFKLKYEKIEIICNKGCKKYYNLENYINHIIECKLNECINYEECKQKAKFLFQKKEFCSYLCYMKKTECDKNMIQEIKSKMKKKKRFFDISKNFIFNFNFQKSSKTFTLNKKTNKIQNNSKKRQFNTIISNVALLGGIHKFNFLITKPKNHFKIGVTKNINKINPENKSFSDYKDGYAFYTIGQTRNDSIDSGLKYGKKINLKKSDLINVKMTVNMGEGKISFFSEDFGFAFYKSELCEGPIYPALAFFGNVENVEIVNYFYSF